MKLSIRGKGLALAVASASLVAVPFITSAEAAGTSHVTCGVVTSGKLTAKGAAASKFSSCTPATLKSGTGSTTKTPPPGTKKGQVGFKITWAGGKGTTTAAVSFSQNPSIGKCPKTPATAGWKRLIVKGTVKAATGAAKAITKLGEPVTASQCVQTAGPNIGSSKLEPGTKFKL